VSVAISLSGTQIDTISNIAVTGTITSDIQLDGAGNGTVTLLGSDATLASGVFPIDFGSLGTASLTLQSAAFNLTSSAIATANNTFGFDGTDAQLTFDSGSATLVGTSGPLTGLLPPPGVTINFATNPAPVALAGFGIMGTATANPPGVSIPLPSIAVPLESVLPGLSIDIDGTIQAQGTALAADTIGQFNPSTATSFFRNSNSSGVPDVTPFNYGIPGWVPLTGDWNGDGTDTIGLYNSGASTFFLRNTNNSGNADIVFNYGIPGWVPLAGDWNGDGIDTVALYNPATATFFLRNTNDTGVADITFNYGLPGWTPLAGDWNADQTDTIGAFNGTTATFFLRNFNSSGVADVAAFNFGGSAWLPVTGDWNGDGIDTIGVVDPASATFYLRDANLAGAPDVPPFQYGAPGWIPLTGNWDGSATGPAAQAAPSNTLELAMAVAYRSLPQREEPTVSTSPMSLSRGPSPIDATSIMSVPVASSEANTAHDEVFRSLRIDDTTSPLESLEPEQVAERWNEDLLDEVS